MQYSLVDFLARSTDTLFDETDLAKALGALPPVTADGPWLAGGALRRTLLGQDVASDFDFFFRDEEQLDAFRDALRERGLRQVAKSDHHFHYRGRLGDSDLPRDIQCIRFAYYADAAAVVDSFDFTICQFAFDGETLTCGEHALWDLGRKRLAIHRITYPVSTMRRMLKYAKQGFTACNGAMAAILRETASSPELLTNLGVAYVD